MKKQCFKCGRVLDIDEFYTHPGMKDGHLGKCKECTKHDTITRSRQNPEKVRAYEKIRAQTEERKKNRRFYVKKYRQEHPERNAIMLQVQRAIKKGVIVKPKTCCICGDETKLYAHHPNYKEPLNVIFVCQSCHKKIHCGLNKKEKL